MTTVNEDSIDKAKAPDGFQCIFLKVRSLG